jgi:hypothetical protein
MKDDIKNLSIGSAVQWKWLGRVISGKIKEVYFKPVTKIIKGKSIKRNGSQENPAYLVESDAGNVALKLGTEIEFANKVKLAATKPKMFGN